MIEKNEWSPLSTLLSDLIVKYADTLNIDSLPEPVVTKRENKIIKNHEYAIAKEDIT